MSSNTDDGIVSSERRKALKTLGATGIAGVASSTTVSASGPTAVIDHDLLPLEAGESFTLDGSSSTGNVQTYEWYLQNWSTSHDWLSSPSDTGPTFEEPYGLSEGPWGVKLVVADDNGNTDEAVINLLVQPENSLSPNAVIETSPESSDRDAFSARFSTTPRGSIESYEWNYYNTSFKDSFSDTPDATGPDFNERFASGYTWKVRLRVTNSDGRTDEHIIEYTPQ